MQFSFKLKYVQKSQLLLYGLIEIHIAWFWLSDIKLSVSLFFFILKCCKVYLNLDYRHYLMCRGKKSFIWKGSSFPLHPHSVGSLVVPAQTCESAEKFPFFFSLHNLYGNDVGREHGKNMEREKGEIHFLHTLQWSFSYKKELLLSTRGSLSFFYGEAGGRCKVCSQTPVPKPISSDIPVSRA